MPDETETEDAMTPHDGLRPDGGGDDPDEPLGDLTRRIREKHDGQPRDERDDADGPSGSRPDEQNTSDPLDSDGAVGAAEADELFEEMDVSDLDADEVWESVLTDDDGGDIDEAVASTVDLDPAIEVESTVGEEHLVPKDDYCESCHFFTAPPDVGCSYDGAEIIELTDMEQFRVRNCPVVEGAVDTDGVVRQSEDGGVAEGTPSD